MARELPTCKNETCPCFRSNREVIILVDHGADISFGCKACGGVQVVTMDWRRAEQKRYEMATNPEYARERKRFFLGKYSHRGG